MMKSRKYTIIILKLIILISVLVNIYSKYNDNFLMMIALSTLIILSMINDYIRNVKLNRDTKYAYISLFFSICTTMILQYFADGLSSSINSYSSIFDIFQFETRIIKIFIPIHSILYFLIIALKSDPHGSMGLFFNLGIQLLAYLGIIGMLHNQKILQIEKEEIKSLNRKLKLANIKLQEYALEVEEITISRERTRVAQELHDSLGHSLMALVMHLEFAKKICATKPQKVEEILEQSEKIAKSSINDLRKAVTLLNSELEIIDFDTSIEKLINNFYLVSNLKITCTKNRSINCLSSLIKTSIYKTIQECITNSLKHGNATEINIKITATNENVEFIITDNGIGCNNIIKSNGLNGIENRINSLGGTTYYFSHNDLGFGIRAFILI